MRSPSIALERFVRWTEADDATGAVARFRRWFAAIWVTYDALDLAFGMTERSRIWFPHEREPGLAAVQGVLLVSGLLLVRGRFVWPAGMVAAGARAFEAFEYFSLNDFFFGSVVYLWLAHSDGGPFAPREGPGRSPRWVRDVLLAQLAWVYLATGVLKLNPDWLSGGHIFVRTQYLWTSHGWPYPGALERAFASMAFDARLSLMGAAMEITLGAVLLARRPYWLAALLVIGIHTVGAVITNVWFFSASMVAGVLILLPRARQSIAR
jgi:hypothetical protein